MWNSPRSPNASSALGRLKLAEALADRDRVDRRGGHVAGHARRAQIGTQVLVIGVPEREMQVRAETGQGLLAPAPYVFQVQIAEAEPLDRDVPADRVQACRDGIRVGLARRAVKRHAE